jgi:hypothetical protein
VKLAVQRIIVIPLTALLLAIIGTALPSPASASGHSHFGEGSREVAREIGCKRWHGTGGSDYVKSGGICWVKGKRVNVLTFTGPKQERTWNRLVLVMFGKHFFWARGTGAVVVAKNGNRPAARIGAHRLPGIVVHGL